ncbi:MAG: TIGR04100 family radical SAM protein [Ruminococcus sp.]|nr:TIGR04100 family radical SAM protein [Ruminococcus sp.]
MKRSMTLTYEVGNGLYVNVTNKCPCSCTFCIRNNGDGAYGSDPLWLEHQPTAEEIIEDLKRRDLDKYSEVVFCGYGEPTCELETMLKAADYIKSVSSIKTRLNTNGLGNIINGRSIEQELKGRLDSVSVSLNAPTKEEYDAVTRPSFKDTDCFAAMFEFAKRVKEYVPEVMFTVVDVIGQDKIELSRQLAEKAGIKLRVREYISE